MKKAVIAIGSNSTRLLVADCGKTLENRYMGRSETRLFMALGEDGALDTEAMERTVRALSAMKLEAESRGADEITLLATSATRDAKNADEFERMIRERTGLNLRVISGEEEATCSFFAAAGKNDRAVMDIGGGSTEYTRGVNGEILYVKSTQMGASRLLKSTGINSARDAEKALTIAKETLTPAAEEMLRFPKAEKMIGLGGTCTTAAAIMHGYYPVFEDAEGMTVSLDTAREQLDMLAGMSEEERASVPGLPVTRVKHMPHGLCILIASMELLGFDSVTVSDRTILDGYLLKQAPEI